MGNLRWTNHCLERIHKRHLTKELVQWIIDHPTEVVPDTERADRVIHQGRAFDLKEREVLVRVVLEIRTSENVVVSVYPTTQFGRYEQEGP